MFSVQQIEVLRKVGGQHSHRIGHIQPYTRLVVDEPAKSNPPVRARTALPSADPGSWRARAIRACVLLPEVTLYVAVGAVLAWAPVGGTLALVLLPGMMMLVVVLPWIRSRMFPAPLERESETSAGPGAPPTVSHVEPRSCDVVVRRALHRDARFEP